MTKQTTAGEDKVGLARQTLLEGVGREIASSFPGITRLGGQIVAALYLTDGPLSMDDLAVELGRSKSNIFANLRALEGAGIVERQRAAGLRHDTFALRGKYPDVVVGAYLARVRRVVIDKCALCRRSLDQLGDADGAEADALRAKLESLLAKYERFAAIYAELVPHTDGPIDLESLANNLPGTVFSSIAGAARRALGLGPAAVEPEKKAAGKKR